MQKNICGQISIGSKVEYLFNNNKIKVVKSCESSQKIALIETLELLC